MQFTPRRSFESPGRGGAREALALIRPILLSSLQGSTTGADADGLKRVVIDAGLHSPCVDLAQTITVMATAMWSLHRGATVPSYSIKYVIPFIICKLTGTRLPGSAMHLSVLWHRDAAVWQMEGNSRLLPPWRICSKKVPLAESELAWHCGRGNGEEVP